MAIERGSLTIEPRPEAIAFSSTSVDLTLDPVLSNFRTHAGKGVETIVDPALDGFDHDLAMEELTSQCTIDPTSGYLLQPKVLVLGWTAEYLDLRNEIRLAARVEGKSSLARLGLGIHVTAPIIHAGFDGRIRLEIINHGYMPIRLRAGMRICQLVFEQTLGTPDKGYAGQFSGQTASTPSS